MLNDAAWLHFQFFFFLFLFLPFFNPSRSFRFVSLFLILPYICCCSIKCTTINWSRSAIFATCYLLLCSNVILLRECSCRMFTEYVYRHYTNTLTFTQQTMHWMEENSRKADGDSGWQWEREREKKCDIINLLVVVIVLIVRNKNETSDSILSSFLETVRKNLFIHIYICVCELSQSSKLSGLMTRTHSHLCAD